MARCRSSPAQAPTIGSATPWACGALRTDYDRPHGGSGAGTRRRGSPTTKVEYGILTEAGGNLNIYSEPGIGTTIKVHLPASDGTPLRTQATPARARAGRGESVLIVEDEPGVRLLTQRILERAGYNVLVAMSGSSALEICERQEQPIDLLLTDVVMLEMQGSELVARAAVIRPGLTVLFMSGYVHQVIAGPDPVPGDPLVELIEKPFTAETLLLRVRGALDGAAIVADV
jgi:two-component system cell cycle sensor histidine kinase/response regulator CckA